MIKMVIKGKNPIVPYDGIEGKMKINKVKFLNHRWIVADFTDGTYWGEMVLEYYINNDESIDLNVDRFAIVWQIIVKRAPLTNLSIRENFGEPHRDQREIQNRWLHIPNFFKKGFVFRAQSTGIT